MSASLVTLKLIARASISGDCSRDRRGTSFKGAFAPCECGRCTARGMQFAATTSRPEHAYPKSTSNMRCCRTATRGAEILRPHREFPLFPKGEFRFSKWRPLRIGQANQYGGPDFTGHACIRLFQIPTDRNADPTLTVSVSALSDWLLLLRKGNSICPRLLLLPSCFSVRGGWGSSGMWVRGACG